MDEPDRDGVQVVELLAASPLADHEARLLELLEVLHDAEARHLEACLERMQRLAVLTEELVEQAPSGRIGKGSEHLVHGAMIGDYLVTCQAGSSPGGPLIARVVSSGLWYSRQETISPSRKRKIPT